MSTTTSTTLRFRAPGRLPRTQLRARGGRPPDRPRRPDVHPHKSPRPPAPSPRTPPPEPQPPPPALLQTVPAPIPTTAAPEACVTVHRERCTSAGVMDVEAGDC